MDAETKIHETEISLINRTIEIEPIIYSCPTTRQVWKKAGYETNLSTDLVHTGKNYADSLLVLLQTFPESYGMAGPELMIYISQQAEKAKKEGGNARAVLDDPLFACQIKNSPRYLCEHTSIALRPPRGAEDFTKYVERFDGRIYSRVDVYKGENLAAEGALMPWGKGLAVVEINPVTGLPAAVSEGFEPDHVMHSLFEPEMKYINVDIGGSYHHGNHNGLGRCLDFIACWPPPKPAPHDAFRVVKCLP